MHSFVYLGVVLSGVVNFLLLMATRRLCGSFVRFSRVVLAAVLSMVYSFCCVVPQLYFLGNRLWHVVFLILISIIAFGYHRKTLNMGILYGALSFVIGELVNWNNRGTVRTVIIMGLFFALGSLAFSGQTLLSPYLSVDLYYEKRHIKLTALKDTGNLLRDPVTGRPVLIVSAEIAEDFFGLSQEQLKQPLESLENLPGFRLIPYRTIGQNVGFLLGLKLQKVSIGSWQGSMTVAFSPVTFSSNGIYQALTGGNL